jgi:hypothetical protein
MRTVSCILLSAFCLILSTAYSQKCERVLLKGKVMDTIQPQGFYNLMIINSTSGRGVFGQPDGSFSVFAASNDSITLSTKNYPMLAFRVVPDSNCQMSINGVLEHKSILIREVAVKPLKSLQQIKEERASLSMRETRMVTGLEVMQSPITALYQRFSQKEQSKRAVAGMEYKDDQEKVLKELLRLYISYDIVNLDEDQFENFIAFLNIDDTFLKTSSDMELITFIKDKYEHFSRMNDHYYQEPPRK